MSVTDKATGKTSARTVTLSKDEGNRPETSADGLASLKPVIDGGVITAGNASQLSDGASACVVMEAGLAAQRGLQPLGRYVRSEEHTSELQSLMRLSYAVFCLQTKT